MLSSYYCKLQQEFRQNQQEEIEIKTQPLQIALAFQKYLSCLDDGQSVTAKVLGERVGISKRYAQQILQALRDEMGLQSDRHGWRLKPAESVEVYRADDEPQKTVEVPLNLEPQKPPIRKGLPANYALKPSKLKK